jgi:hypothetical protein
MLPQANAQLTSIAGGGLSEDDGGSYVAGADTPKWTGLVDAYVHEEVLATAGADGLDDAKLTYIVIPGGLPVSEPIIPADTVSFTYAGQSVTRIVQRVATHSLPSHLKTTRIFLRDT